MNPTNEPEPGQDPTEKDDAVGSLRRWAEGFRHAAANRHYHLDPVTARATAWRLDLAAKEVERLRFERDEITRVAGALWCVVAYFQSRGGLSSPPDELIEHFLEEGDPAPDVVAAIRTAAGLDP